jgi:hypothetical protein
MATTKTSAKATEAPKSSAAGDRRRTVVEALRRAKATSVSKALGVGDLAEKSGLDHRLVYGACNGLAGKAGSDPRCLVATGHVAAARVPPKDEAKDGAGTLGFYLTPKGAKGKLDVPPFVAGPLGNGKAEK